MGIYQGTGFTFGPGVDDPVTTPKFPGPGDPTYPPNKMWIPGLTPPGSGGSFGPQYPSPYQAPPPVTSMPMRPALDPRMYSGDPQGLMQYIAHALTQAQSPPANTGPVYQGTGYTWGNPQGSVPTQPVANTPPITANPYSPFAPSQPRFNPQAPGARRRYPYGWEG